MPHQQPVIAAEAADGHRFELIEIPLESPARTVLLLPGLGISARHYIDFAAALSRAGGARVLIHEWRGNGSSNRRAGRRQANGDWGYRELLELDLPAALEASAEPASQPIWLAGHSLGAQLAALTASREPERFAGLALIASGSPYAPAFPWKMRLILNVAFRLFPMLSGLVGHFPGKRLGFAGTEAHQLMVDWCRTGRTGRYDLPTLSWNPETALNQLRLALLTQRMAEDGWVPQGSLDWLLRKMPRAPVTRSLITSEQQKLRADHFNWLRAPEVSAGEIASWMNRMDPVDRA